MNVIMENGGVTFDGRSISDVIVHVDCAHWPTEQSIMRCCKG